MPMEAAERLALRLYSRKELGEIERTGIDFKQFFESAGKKKKETLPEAALYDWNVSHAPGQSTVYNLGEEFATALLEGNEKKLFEHRINQILWTHPKLFEKLRQAREYGKHEGRIAEIREKFARGQALREKNPRKYWEWFVHSRKRPQLSNVLWPALAIAANRAMKENLQTLLDPLCDLCQEIAEQRGREGRKVDFSIKVEHGDTDFGVLSHKKQVDPQPTTIEIAFKRKA